VYQYIELLSSKRQKAAALKGGATKSCAAGVALRSAGLQPGMLPASSGSMPIFNMRAGSKQNRECRPEGRRYVILETLAVDTTQNAMLRFANQRAHIIIGDHVPQFASRELTLCHTR
jgi:hypothetical protein